MRNNIVRLAITLLMAGTLALRAEENKQPDAKENVDSIIVKLNSAPSDANLLGSLAKAAMTEPEEAKKARALAICYTGYILMNRHDIAAQAKGMLLRDCAISSYAQLIETNSFFTSAICDSCKGKGTQPEVCPACKNVRALPHDYNKPQGVGLCHGCNGSGSRAGVGNRPVKCASCLGKQICMKCNGSGSTETACKLCKAGKIHSFDKQKARDTYAGLLKE